MDPVGTVSVSEKETAIRQEGIVSRHERVPAPPLGRFGRFVRRVNSRIHRSALFPDLFPLEGQLGEILQLLIGSHIQELLLSFPHHLEPVTAALKLFPKRAHKLSFSIE